MYFMISFYLLTISLILFFSSLIFILFNIKILIKINIMKFMSFNMEFIMFIDWMSLIFISVVFMISSMVLIYSMEYMYNHIYIERFMKLIMIFFLSMMLMIISPNMLSMLFGWDGLGLSSYCLIIFYQNKKTFNSGMITILMNRIGDINILIMISLLINFNSMNFLFLKNYNNIIMVMIMMAAITKSAQIPFSTWLPLAMAAPTPVSSLVHSSTLVTAGIYLLIRLSYLLNKKFLMMLMFISLWTMLLASSTAMFEFDLKKIIALSTLSQLALMFLSISMNLSLLSFFHLITHAMFKSLLFLCSGIIIHNYFNNQDIRMISMMNYNMPLINMIFNIASLTLCGMPFLSGFYSKDLIIEFFNMNNMNSFTFNLMYVCMMMTTIYSFRLIYYISMKSTKMIYFNKFYSSNKMNYSIYLLFLFSMFYGSMMNWILINSMNLIILNIKMKILIWKLMINGVMMIVYLSMKMKLNKIMIKFWYWLNYLWFLNNMFKKSKMNLFKMNLNMNLIEMMWLEYLSSKKLIYMMFKFNKNKNFNKLNFSIIMTFISYIIIIMFLF
uniref:NADH-ubiquinone oxidoreductase chain 5 n=1 Tax=Meteorus pulchricornis TaxID=51522 RepID=D8WHE4_9HYME|nr:NADH dehydrogenase subunit 5 [Meteorus pulchricornis]ACY09467.1 NADH dehydrogenase subunit 5 [Meteorus pulchricornis]QHS69746.1 NADH dehydrogenase subunit 5 [Meteorus pulchricornis]WCB99549.1 NADH dehydrogenase subunit 5 [Meteorus pulchricornis]